MDRRDKANRDDAAGRQPTARLHSPRVSLRPIGQHDYDMLRHYELGEELILRWRHRGMTPSPEDYQRGLWAGVVAQFIVQVPSTRLPIGLIACYNADLVNRHAYLAGAKFDPADRSVTYFEAGVLFLDYVFETWEFRKLYMEVPQYNLSQIHSATTRLFVEEGRFKDHIYTGGRTWDQHILSITRESWQAGADRLRQFVFRDIRAPM